MATYKGQDIAPEDQGDNDLKLRGGRLPGMENAEEELGLWPEAGSDRPRRPGEKGYTGKDIIANRDATSGAFRTGGPKKQPDFAIGGGMLNAKFSNKGDK